MTRPDLYARIRAYARRDPRGVASLIRTIHHDAGVGLTPTAELILQEGS